MIMVSVSAVIALIFALFHFYYVSAVILLITVLDDFIKEVFHVKRNV